MSERKIKSLVFDKDGVILDLAETWVPVIRAIADFTVSQVPRKSRGDVDRATLLKQVGIEDESGAVDPVGLFARGSHADVRDAWQAVLPDGMIDLRNDADYLCEVRRISNELAFGKAVPKGDVATPLKRLADAGFKLALLTNDSEESARQGLAEIGIDHLFSPFLGADSGHDAKPKPHGLLHCCREHGSLPEQTLMVGDTGADYGAAVNAGVADFICICDDPENRPHESIKTENVITTIAELPDLLIARGDMAPPR